MNASPAPRGYRNTGTAPPCARVWVKLRNGRVPEQSWATATTRWTLEDHPFDVIAWRPAL